MSKLFPTVMLRVWCVTAAMLTLTSSASAASITLSSDRDTSLLQQPGYDTRNFGASDGYAAGNLTGAQTMLLSFGMNSFATALNGDDFTVQSITLRLTAYTTPSFGNGPTLTPEVHAVTSANQNWVEGTGDGGGLGQVVAGASSWVQKLHGSDDWAGNTPGLIAGVDFETTALSSPSFTSTDGIIAGTKVDFVFTGDLHALLTDWLSYGVQANPGLYIFDPQYFNQDPESLLVGNSRMIFASRDHATEAWHPELLIEYTVMPVPEPNSFALLLGGICGVWAKRRRK